MKCDLTRRRRWFVVKMDTGKQGEMDIAREKGLKGIWTQIERKFTDKGMKKMKLRLGIINSFSHKFR